MLKLGLVDRVAASGSTIYYTPASKVGVKSFDVVTGLSGTISTAVEIVGLSAEDGAADNPFYTDLVSAYSKVGALFSTVGATGTRAELAVSPSDVWLITDSQIFRGPRAPSGVANPIITSAGSAFRELATSATQVFWISGQATAPELDYFPIGGGAQGTVTTGPSHFGVGARAYGSDVAGVLYREPPAFPIGAGAPTPIDTGPVVGRIVPRPSCVYYWSQNSASGDFELRSLVP